MWGNILTEQDLSEKFIIDFADNFNKSNWRSVSIAQNISEKFIKNFADKLNVHELLRNNNLDNDLKEKIKLNFDDWVAEAKLKNKTAQLQFLCNSFYKKALNKFNQS